MNDSPALLSISANLKRWGDRNSGVSKVIDAGLDLLFPLSCVSCGREGRFLCENPCAANLVKLRPPYCRLCASPGVQAVCSWCQESPPSYDRISAPYVMTGAVRDMVLGLKFRNLRAWAPDMGQLLAEFMMSNSVGADVLVPVPLHKRRVRDRGYNQSELLAREVGKQTNIPVEPDLVRRLRNTRPQISMTSGKERRQNVAGAFECTGEVTGRTVLLIDDVVTTGATISACADPLKAAGAASVRALALAR